MDNDEWAERYFAALRSGAESYAAVLTALTEAGLVAEFTQTGGMCAAIYVTTPELPDGYHILLGDSENGPLSWTYEDVDSWSWASGAYTDEEWIEDLDLYDTGLPATPERAVVMAETMLDRLKAHLSS